MWVKGRVVVVVRTQALQGEILRKNTFSLEARADTERSRERRD